MNSFTDHFASVTKGYAAHRPGYPPGLFNWLANIAPEKKLAWDCATGTGQAAVSLAGLFEHVWATDASHAQISGATPYPNITYQTAPAHASGMPDASADLVTVAQALHWFDLDSFYNEVRRVLKPEGVLAVWTYGVFKTDGDGSDHIQELLDSFYCDTVGPFWPSERRHVEDGYTNLSFPFSQLSPPDLSMSVDWSLSDLCGYLRSWSATSRYCEHHLTDPVTLLAERLLPLWGEVRRRVVWPLSIKAGKL